jgi:biopolymer transport protein TolR
MRRKNRKKRVRRFELPEVSLTPLIDTALTLLVIFMITAPIVQNGIHVQLPQGNSKEVGNQQELVITVSKDEKMFFNSYPLLRRELVETVTKAMVGREDNPVYVRADESLSYGRVISIVDELKEAGVRSVAMSTRAIGG